MRRKSQRTVRPRPSCDLEAGETFELDPVAEAELLASIAEAERGEIVPAEDVLRAFAIKRHK